MSHKDNLITTISTLVDETSRKPSLPVTTHLTHPTISHGAMVRRSHSLSGANANGRMAIKREPSIPEGDNETENASTATKVEDTNSAIDSNPLRGIEKRSPSDTGSITAIRTKILEARVFDNSVYGDHERHFHRSHMDSTRSSTHSLQIQREQYCCCARWSPFERKLALSVGILGSVIIGLTIAIGLMAGNDENELGSIGARETFIWKA